LEQALEKTEQKPGFSIKSREAGQAKLASPKTEVLEQPQFIIVVFMGCPEDYIGNQWVTGSNPAFA
jgi:hypothetical protein